jgi:Alr-MurF fusion protein
LGTAHDENFPDVTDKLNEKLKLFSEVKSLIYCADHQRIHQAVKSSNIPSLSWGRSEADILIENSGENHHVHWRDINFTVRYPFTDAASIENANHCIAVMLALGYTPQTISQRIQALHSVPMRLELKEGINQCQVIDDTYNNDLGGLQISLDFLKHQQQKKKRSLILSDILQSGLPHEKLVMRIADLVNNSGLSKLIGIGPVLSQYKELFHLAADFYLSTEAFLDHFQPDEFHEQIILVKGARVFRFERIAKVLERKVHGTVMEVNLGALVQNLNYFKSKLNSGVKLMVMVKAFAYGSGSAQIANVLQYHQVGYLGVAYADEGVDLRRHNIALPIMVMNPVAEGFQAMLTYSLEPELYNFKVLTELVSFLNGRILSVHLKLDTGMHRLGFDQDEIQGLIETLRNNPNIKVASIFSHLVGADEKEHDAYTRLQAEKFLRSATAIKEELGINPLLHILNTSGIIRFPELQLNMVRLGIGLYGVDPTGSDQSIKSVVTLKSIISQIKNIKKGESVGYGRKGIADKNMKLATIAIGYADGYSRAFSRGVGQVLISGNRANVIGNVCMDMTMIDITGIEAQEGDEVIIFGEKLPIQEVAKKINTIPYEILTNTSDRVKRVFFAEGI